MSSRNSLTCFGVGGNQTRLYSLDGAGNIGEIGWNGGWSSANITSAAGAPAAMAGSALTCFGIGGSVTRLYYFDTANNPVEIGWNNGWYSGRIGPSAITAAPNSPMACFGVNGAVTRLYYFDAGNQVVEVGWNNGWYSSGLGASIGAPPAAPGTGLGCFGVGGAASRVYYIDTTSQVIELAWNGGWSFGHIGAAAKESQSFFPGAPTAAPQSALTCFGVGGAASRVYYLDGGNQVIELAWNDGWFYGRAGAAAGAPPARAGSPLTCFGVGGDVTRLYYFDGGGHVVELGWNNGWYFGEVGSSAGAPPAEPGSGLTCFGVSGQASRVYYTDANGNAIELGFANGGWYWGIVPPIELRVDIDSITFSDGVAAGGFTHLVLRKNGSYTFSGHFHDSGAPDYNIGLVLAVKDSQNRAYTFQHASSLHGTFSSGSRDDDWQIDGQNSAISENWSDLTAAMSWHWEAKASADFVAITNDVIGALGTVTGIIGIVIAL